MMLLTVEERKEIEKGHRERGGTETDRSNKREKGWGGARGTERQKRQEKRKRERERDRDREFKI